MRLQIRDQERVEQDIAKIRAALEALDDEAPILIAHSLCCVQCFQTIQHSQARAQVRKGLLVGGAVPYSSVVKELKARRLQPAD